jgi:hypothetical protein
MKISANYSQITTRLLQSRVFVTLTTCIYLYELVHVMSHVMKSNLQHRTISSDNLQCKALVSQSYLLLKTIICTDYFRIFSEIAINNCLFARLTRVYRLRHLRPPCAEYKIIYLGSCGIYSH